MLSFLALMIVMLLSLNQTRSIVQAEREITGVEMEVIAHAKASEQMQYIVSKPFDMNTRNGTIHLSNQDLSSLTHPSQFPRGWVCDSEGEDNCDDVDDFNEMQPLVRHFSVGEDTLQLPFEITATVKYVDDYGNPTNTRTWVKEVTVIVDQLVEQGGVRYLSTPVVLKRRVSPRFRRVAGSP
ncbi:MAG: hypothetical protein ACE5G0_18560 [Rhodothermales bacterium]